MCQRRRMNKELATPIASARSDYRETRPIVGHCVVSRHLEGPCLCIYAFNLDCNRHRTRPGIRRTNIRVCCTGTCQAPIQLALVAWCAVLVLYIHTVPRESIGLQNNLNGRKKPRQLMGSSRWNCQPCASVEIMFWTCLHNFSVIRSLPSLCRRSSSILPDSGVHADRIPKESHRLDE